MTNSQLGIVQNELVGEGTGTVSGTDLDSVIRLRILEPDECDECGPSDNGIVGFDAGDDVEIGFGDPNPLAGDLCVCVCDGDHCYSLSVSTGEFR